MSRSVGCVVFPCGKKRYLIFDGTVDLARRPLFLSAESAWAWYEAGSLEYAEPTSASASALPVVVTEDVADQEQSNWTFETTASLEHLWLTGPRNWFESVTQNHDTGDCVLAWACD